jgi:hypothetical protein
VIILAWSFVSSVVVPRSNSGVGRIGSPRRIRPSVATKRISRSHTTRIVLDFADLIEGFGAKAKRRLEGKVSKSTTGLNQLFSLAVCVYPVGMALFGDIGSEAAGRGKHGISCDGFIRFQFAISQACLGHIGITSQLSVVKTMWRRHRREQLPNLRSYLNCHMTATHGLRRSIKK